MIKNQTPSFGPASLLKTCSCFNDLFCNYLIRTDTQNYVCLKITTSKSSLPGNLECLGPSGRDTALQSPGPQSSALQPGSGCPLGQGPPNTVVSLPPEMPPPRASCHCPIDLTGGLLPGAPQSCTQPATALYTVQSRTDRCHARFHLHWFPLPAAMVFKPCSLDPGMPCQGQGEQPHLRLLEVLGHLLRSG